MKSGIREKGTGGPGRLVKKRALFFVRISRAGKSNTWSVGIPPAVAGHRTSATPKWRYSCEMALHRHPAYYSYQLPGKLVL